MQARIPRLASRLAFPLLLLCLAYGTQARLRAARDAVVFGGQNYYGLGLNLKRSGILGYPSEPGLPTAFRGPLYPSFIASLLPDGASPFPRGALYAQALLGSLAILGVYALGTAVSGPLAGLLAAAAYAVDADLIAFCASLDIEHFYSLLLLAIAGSLVAWGRDRGPGPAWQLGLLLGVSLTCRSSLALFPALLALWCLSPCPPFQESRRMLPALILGSLLPLLPWAGRNALQFRKFIPFERHAAAANLYAASEGMTMTLVPEHGRWLVGQGDRTLEAGSVEERNEAMVERAWANIADRPWRYLSSTLGRLAYIWGLHPWLWSFALLCLPLRRLVPLALLPGLLALYFLLTHSLLAVEGRYLVPLLPVLMVLALASAVSLAGVVLARVLPSTAPAPGPWSSPSMRPLDRALKVSLAFFAAVFVLSLFFLAGELRRTGLRRSAPLVSGVETHLRAPSAGQGPRGDAESLNDRGVERFLKGDLKGAEEDFRASLLLRPGFDQPWLSLGAALSRQGRHAEALKACAEAARLTTPEAAAPLARAMPALSPGHDLGMGRLGLHAAALDCCAAEATALGRPQESRRYAEASRRLKALVAERVRQAPGPGRPALLESSP
jgi:hypothetical protein